MPNGNPAFNLAEQETWFAPLAQAIGEVADKHNLLLDKYYHEGASWDLRFNHPRGGQASVTIYNGGAAAQVGSVWYLDDYDLSTRFIHSRPLRQIPKQSDSVRQELEIEVRGHPRVARRAVDSDREGLRANLESILTAAWSPAIRRGTAAPGQ